MPGTAKILGAGGGSSTPGRLLSKGQENNPVLPFQFSINLKLLAFFKNQGLYYYYS